MNDQAENVIEDDAKEEEPNNDHLVDELIETNSAFRELLQRSAASGRKPFCGE